MHRRSLILTGLAAGLPLPAFAQNTGAQDARPQDGAPQAPPPADNGTPGQRPKHYSKDEIIRAGSDALGGTAEAIGGAIEHVFKDRGDSPTAYIAGTEGSGAFGVGARYGKGLLYMVGGDVPVTVYWQGPSVGFDTGGNASRVFTLCYGLDDVNRIYQRFPGVEGSAYFVGGLGVNYQRADDITLAPIRAGVGLRLGANIGYLSYSKKRHFIPL